MKPPETLTKLSDDGVFIITMNRPEKLNGWTENMMLEMQSHFKRAAKDEKVKVVILTGAGKYYCAGVNLSGVIRPMLPKNLHTMIREKNQLLFDMFLDFQKPILAAVNGPAIGASVTSAILCDAIVANETATFSTPFFRLGVPPEGCSSVHFPRIFGSENADLMMGEEAWVPTANEAMELGFVHTVVPVPANGSVNGYDHTLLLNSSIELAQEWIAKGKPREIGPLRGGPEIAEEYKRVNARESLDLADCFLGNDFLEGQRAFLSSKGKTGPALVFSALKWTRPLWSLLLPSKN